MTTLSQINAGARITASMLRSVAPLSAYKGADETISTGVGTLQNDDALFLTVEANSVYLFDAFIVYEGGTQGSSDLRIGWSVPSLSTMGWTQLAKSTTGVAIAGNFSVETGTPPLGTGGAGGRLAAVLQGTLATSGTPGTFQFRWCQNSGTAVNTIVHAGSLLAAWKISG